MVDAILLSILACPQCQSDVKADGEKVVCCNPKCGLRYPVVDGIPVMLVDEAEGKK